MGVKKKAAPAKSKRPTIGGKGNKVAKAVPEEVEISEQPRLVEALQPPAPTPKSPEWVKSGEVPASVDGPIPTPAPKSKSEVKRRKAQGDKSVAQLQAESFDPAAINAAFKPTNTPPFAIPGLDGPALEVAALIIERLGEFVDSMGDTPSDKAPQWDGRAADLGADFGTLALKRKAFSVVEGLADKEGEKLKDKLVMAMEVAGITGDDAVGVGVGPLRAVHTSKETVKTDVDELLTYLLERGVNPQLLDDARKHATTRDPYAYVAFYRMVDQRAMNMAAHTHEGEEGDWDVEAEERLEKGKGKGKWE